MTPMLQYSKLILEKVSFDRRLFWKEYKKLHRGLDGQEVSALRHWVREEFINKTN